MAVALSTIRQGVIARLPHTLIGTVGSGTTASELFDLDDELVTFSGQGAKDYTGYWIVISQASSADRVRRVAKHDPSGSIRPSRPWSTAPTANWTYELLPPELHPNAVDRAINKGLKRLSYLNEETLTPVSNTNTYSLASYTWITNERDLREVYWQATNSGYTIREPWRWWKVTRDATALTLRLDPAPTDATGNSIILEGIARYTALASDSATTNCAEDWAVAAGVLEVLRYLRRSNPGLDVSRWGVDFREASKEFMAQSRKHAPRRGRRVMTRTPGPRGVYTPRRGEFLY